MLWNTISSRRGCPLRRPLVVMSIVCPRWSAASIVSFVTAILSMAYRSSETSIPHRASMAQVVERVRRHEVDRLGGLARPLQMRGKPDMADLDHPMFRHDPHEAGKAAGGMRLAVDEGERQGIVHWGALLEPGHEV